MSPDTPSSPTILVTGASGFAGSHLVDRLAGGAPLVAWHRPGGPAPAARDGVSWRAVDLRDGAQVAAGVAEARPSHVYHVAGAARVDAAWNNVVPHLESNVLGTHHLLDAVRASGAPCRVLVVSSAMVYQVDAAPIGEDAPLIPGSPYGLSKLAQDLLARCAAADGLDVVVARPFNHIGPRQHPDFAVSSFARQIARIEAGQADPVIYVGNLDAERDFTDVRDVVDAYARLMTEAPSGRAYNICSGRAVRIGDTLDELLRHARIRVSVVPDPARLRPSDMPRFVGDPARIRQELGWIPRYALPETLCDTLDWWRAQVRTADR